uniref:hypothetical protein n=1 Tax=Xanthomonas sp. 0924 TaxID=2835534 RepID=UPI003F81626B
MSKGIPTRKRKPIVMRIPAGTTVQIGNQITIELRGAHKNSAELHIYAPSTLSVDRKQNFTPDWTVKNNNGPSAPTLEPSASNSVIDQD